MRVAAALLLLMAIAGYALASWYTVTAIRGALRERRRRRQGEQVPTLVRRAEVLQHLPGGAEGQAPEHLQPRTVLGYVHGLRSCFAVPHRRSARVAAHLSNRSRLFERGFHARSIARLEYRLRGMWGRTWDSPRATATCDSGRDRGSVPHSLPCRCGVNMYSLTPERVTEMLAVVDHRTVVALTRGWGDRVVVHEDGYRVAEAEIVAILVHPRVLERARPGRPFAGRGWDRVLITSDVPAFLAQVGEHRRTPIVEIPAAEA
jgi:hypothetical protein